MSAARTRPSSAPLLPPSPAASPLLCFSSACLFCALAYGDASLQPSPFVERLRAERRDETKIDQSCAPTRPKRSSNNTVNIPWIPSRVRNGYSEVIKGVPTVQPNRIARLRRPRPARPEADKRGPCSSPWPTAYIKPNRNAVCVCMRASCLLLSALGSASARTCHPLAQPRHRSCLTNLGPPHASCTVSTGYPTPTPSLTVRELARLLP